MAVTSDDMVTEEEVEGSGRMTSYNIYNIY